MNCNIIYIFSNQSKNAVVEIVRGKSAVHRKYVVPPIVCSYSGASICLDIEGTVDGRWIFNY